MFTYDYRFFQQGDEEPGVLLRCRHPDGRETTFAAAWSFFKPILTTLYSFHFRGEVPDLRLLQDWKQCEGFYGVPSRPSPVELAPTVQALRRIRGCTLEGAPDRHRSYMALADLTVFLERARIGGAEVTIVETPGAPPSTGW